MQELKNLNLTELNNMLKHIRSGQEHLKKELSKEDFTKLLRLGTLGPKEYENIKADSQEHAGNITLVLNTLITSILGSWLGFSGFIGLGLKSVPLLIAIIIITMTASGWIGWISFKATQKKAKEGIITKKLRVIELKLLKEIIKLHNHDLSDMIQKIISTLGATTPKFKKDKQQQKIIARLLEEQHYLNRVYQLIDEHTQEFLLSNASAKASKALKNKIDTLLSELKLITQAEAKKKSPTTQETAHHHANSYIKTLAAPCPKAEPAPLSSFHWLKQNITAIVTGTMPTLIGSFASMFVFLGGIPDILKAFNINIKSDIQHEVLLQILCILIALLLTVYYCYSYLHSNYKNFLRSKEIEKTEKNIAEANDSINKINSHFNRLAQINNVLEELAFIRVLVRAIKRVRKK